MIRKFTGFLLQIMAIMLTLAWLGGCQLNPPQGGQRTAAADVSIDVDEQTQEQIRQLKVPLRLRQQILLLYAEDPQRRASAAQTLAKHGRSATSAIPYLMDLLKDDRPVQLSRYMGSGFYSSTETTPANEAAHALAKIGDPALAELSRVAQSGAPSVRRLAIRALGQIHDLSSIDLLIDALKDPDRHIQTSAVIGLGNYRHPLATERITQRFADLPASARIQLVYAIARINDIMAVPFLVNEYAKQDVQIRAAMVLALGKLRDARAIDTLIAAAQDQDEIIRANALHALASYYTPRVIELLINSLADDLPQIRRTASESLQQLTGLDYGVQQQDWQSWWRAQKRAMLKGKQSSQ